MVDKGDGKFSLQSKSNPSQFLCIKDDEVTFTGVGGKYCIFTVVEIGKCNNDQCMYITAGN